MLDECIGILEYDDRRTHVDGVDRPSAARRDLAEALFGNCAQQHFIKPCLVARMVHYIGIVARQQLRKHLHQYDLLAVGNGGMRGKKQSADDCDRSGCHAADIGGDVLISKGCEQVDAVHALDGSNGSNALLPGSLVHTEHADVWFSKVGAHRRRIVALCGEVCLQPLQDSRVSLCERLQLHITRLQNMLVGWLSHV